MDALPFAVRRLDGALFDFDGGGSLRAGGPASRTIITLVAFGERKAVRASLQTMTASLRTMTASVKVMRASLRVMTA
jgi:hypothetical protein